MDTPGSFGRWLEKRRKALDLTREEFARKVGCSVSVLRKFESDERRPSKQLAELLANALDIAADERPTFIRIARGELSLERLKSPTRTLNLLDSPRALPRHIPIPPTPLIGRETELAALRQLLADPQCRLITIVGLGGSGKTRLALEVAWVESGSVAFVSLASVASASLLVPTIADALGFTFHGVADPKTQLLHYLREKQMLLILDNMEHLLEGATLIAEILQFAPYVNVLSTSREPLKLRGEWIFEIRGLPVPKEIHSIETESDNAVTLFIERARQARVGFEWKNEDGQALLHICQLVDGMPLAIELAASWVRAISCEEIKEELERNMDFLSTSMRDVPERHRSMRAVFDHSWRLIFEEEQQVLSALTVFRGGFTRGAAEQVAGADLDLLSALMAKSLVQRSGAKRFSLHELVRQYAARQFKTADELERVRLRHISFFTNFAETGKQQSAGPLLAVWLEHMEQDNDNLRAAFDYVITLQNSQMAVRLAAAVWRFWQYRGQLDEGRQWLNAVLGLPQANTHDYVLQRARALIGAGSLARIQGDFAQAHRLSEDGLALQRKIGNIAGISGALNSLGVVTMFEGQYTVAETYLQESLELCREACTEAEIGKRLNNLGVLAMYQGDYEKARLLHEEAMELHRELNDRHGQARALGNLGDVFRYQGQYERAMQVLEESLAILQEVGDIQGTVITLDSIARVHLAKGEVEHALATFGAGLMRNREVGDKTEMANGLEGMADAMRAHAMQSPVREDEIRLAVRLLAAASQLRAMVGAPRSAAEHAEFELIIAQLRDQLSETEFLMELKRGAEMTTEQAVEEALHHLPKMPNMVNSG